MADENDGGGAAAAAVGLGTDGSMERIANAVRAGAAV